MVGHTGNLQAAIEAVTVTDECVKVRLLHACRVAVRAVGPSSAAADSVFTGQLLSHSSISMCLQELLDAVQQCGGRFLAGSSYDVFKVGSLSLKMQ